MTGVTNPPADLWKHFQNVEDPRTDYLIEHKLLDLITLTILAVICGADTWEENRRIRTWETTMVRNIFGVALRNTVS